MKESPKLLLESAWARIDEGDSGGAHSLAVQVLTDGADGNEKGEALLVSAHALILGGNEPGAQTALAQCRDLLADDPDLLTDAANVALALSDAAAAAELSDRAVLLDESNADAAYARSLAAQAVGDRATAIALGLRTAELDASADAPPWAMTVDEFAAFAEETFDSLPAIVIERLENVPIIVEPAPTKELIADGIDPRLLGLFSGVPLTERSILAEGQPSLDAIHLFQRNLENSCVTREELIEEIRITVIHETAHFFGLDDDDLEELGLG